MNEVEGAQYPLPTKIFNRIRRVFISPYRRYAYSQEGEDLILARIYEHKPEGFYVDVGALHPVRFSNTYLFYRQGWRGINIDAAPGSMKAFQRERPRDINLEAAISDEPQILTYFIFNEPALNTFSEELAKIRDSQPKYRLIRRCDIATQTLSAILNKHLPKDQNIDFLSVDVEGLDCQVLRSNDWTRYRPEFVLAEDLKVVSLNDLSASQLILFMERQNYQLYSKTVNTLIFRRRD